MSEGISQKKKFLWKVYFALLVLSLLGAAGIVPYMISLGSGTAVQLSGPLMVLAVFLQSALITAILAFAGLKLSLNTGLGAPIFEKLLYGDSKSIDWGRQLRPAILLGVLCGTVMLVLDLGMIEVFAIEAAEQASAPVWWKGLLASFYGGISEEIMLRLFALNLIIVILNKIDRNSERKTSGTKVVSAMIVSSIIFVLGHIAAGLSSFTINPGFIIRTLVLNFVPGMVFGWLYWRRSLFSAMAAHFITDILVHVVFRYFLDSLA